MRTRRGLQKRRSDASDDRGVSSAQCASLSTKKSLRDYKIPQNNNKTLPVLTRAWYPQEQSESESQRESQM